VVGGPEKCFAISAGGQIAGHPAHWLSLQFPGWLDKLEPILCCHCIAQEAQKKKKRTSITCHLSLAGWLYVFGRDCLGQGHKLLNFNKFLCSGNILSPCLPIVYIIFPPFSWPNRATWFTLSVVRT